jgi:hypothetical protein
VSGFLLAEFATARAATEALERAARTGLPPDDILSPHPLEGVAGRLAPRKRTKRIGWLMFAAGALGAIIGYGVQWYSAVIDYPILSGGRPLNSWPAFLLLPYEVAILSAAVVGILGWMWMCGLPKLFHPLFAGTVGERATQDRYFLVFRCEDNRKAWIEAALEPSAVHEVVP